MAGCLQQGRERGGRRHGGDGWGFDWDADKEPLVRRSSVLLGESTGFIRPGLTFLGDSRGVQNSVSWETAKSSAKSWHLRLLT